MKHTRESNTGKARKIPQLRLEGVFVEEVQTTMNYLKDYSFIDDNTVFYVVAETQKEGQGRKNRKWFSPKGGLYMTIVKKPLLDPSYYHALTAVTVAQTIETHTGYRPSIKWPNDIYTRDYKKKIGGILIKYQEKGDLKRIGIGIGINVTNKIPRELGRKAVSLSELTGKTFDVRKLACSIVKRLLENETLLSNGHQLIQQYREWAPMQGLEAIIVETGEKVIVKGITNKFELEVLEPNNMTPKKLKEESIEILDSKNKDSSFNN